MGLRRFEFYWYGNALTYKTRGDKERAEQLKKEVRIKAAYLFAGLLPKQDYSIGKWNLTDGSKVQVQVMRTPVGERVFARVWAPGGGEESFPLYYLESSFIVPSQESSTVFVTTDAKTVRDISEARFIHNERAKTWSSFSSKEVGFTPQPNGDDLVARSLPLCLGYDEPRDSLNYYRALRRWRKTWQHFGPFDMPPQHLMQGRGPGTSTGKMVLYQRAKLGRKVELWIDENNVWDDYVLNDWAASHTCTGLLTDVFGEYWKVSINDSTTATFTRLAIPPDLRSARDNTTTPGARLFAEAFVLAYSMPTEDVYTVGIAGVPTLTEAPYGKWNPVAYSWHFNWSGTKAVMVVHRGVGSYEVNEGRIDSVQTEIWELAISVGRNESGYVPQVTLSRSGQHQWERITALQSDLVYVPALSFNGKIQQTWSAPGGGTAPGYGAPVDVPIYAWYGTANSSDPANNVIYKVVYSRSRDELPETITGNYSFLFKVCGSTVNIGGGMRTTGVLQTISYKILKDANLVRELSASSTSIVDTRVVSLDPGEEYSVSSGVSGGALSFSDNSTCTTVSTTAVCVPPDYLVLADRITQYWQPTVVRRSENTSNAPPSMSLVVPHDCAEGAMIAKQVGSQTTFKTETYVDRPTPSVKFAAYSNIRGYPSGVPLSPGSATQGLGQADFIITTTSETLHPYDIESFLVGRNSESSFSEASNGIDKAPPTVDDPRGAIEGLVYANYDTLDPTKPALSIFEALGGEMMVRGREDHFMNGFPEGFGNELYPPVLIGSI